MKPNLRHVFVSVCLALVPHLAMAQEAPAPKARHVILVVCDGLRPDSITDKDMPTLHRLGNQGVFFANHHPAYFSSTEVNGVAMATGCYPRHSGVIANREYRPLVDELEPIGIEVEASVRKGDEVTHGRYLGVPTIPEILREHHRTSIVAGTKPVAILWDRAQRDNNAIESQAIDLYMGQTLPRGLLSNPRATGPDQGPAFPAKADSTKAANSDQDRWTTQTLIDRLWAGKLSDFTVLWFSEPDYGQHGSGPGSDVALRGLKSDDDNIALILNAIEKSGQKETTDILVVSDHGFSTISAAIDMTSDLKKAGFPAFKKFKGKPSAGDILVDGNGGSVGLYVIGHDPAVIQKLVDYLQTTDYAGVLFTPKAVPGTFGLSDAGLDKDGAPDVVVSMRWSADLSATGMPGMLVSESLARGPGQGNHASLSRFEMHNTLIASGPDFKHGFKDTLPSANYDVGATLAWLLGERDAVKAMDGRVLKEAFKDFKPDAAAPSPVETELLTADRPDLKTPWRQYLKISHYDGRVYYDEGNAGEAK